MGKVKNIWSMIKDSSRKEKILGIAVIVLALVIIL
jgi:hypothetical protein|tara:strand:- start:213 stop:317 length:105 start_codon:yes stop_codon:yes gene_type:complete